jgi:hypothetical protein
MQEYKKRMTLLFVLLAFDVFIIVMFYLLIAEVLNIEKTNSFLYFILGAILSAALTYGTLKKLK